MASARLYDQVCGFFDRWLRPSRDLRDLSLLEDYDLSDLGVCRSDAVNFASGPRDVRDRIEGMTGRLGLDYAKVTEARWRAVDIARNCTNCSERRACRKYLKGHGAREDYKSFCPNAHTFESLLSAARSIH